MANLRAILANDQEVVCVPAEMFGLQVNFHDTAVAQDRRDAAHEQLSEPVYINVLLEEGAAPSGGGTA